MQTCIIMCRIHYWNNDEDLDEKKKNGSDNGLNII